MEALPIGVHVQWRFCAGVAGILLLRLLAVDGQSDADCGIEHSIALLNPLGRYIHGLLPAAIAAVAHQAFTNDVAGYLYFILTGGEGLENLHDAGLCSVARLQVKAAQRDDRQKGQPNAVCGERR